MENVAEMANAFDGQVRDELLGQLESLGYATTHDIHNAAEFGVPQRRRRVVFIASRTELPMTLPEPTHALEATRRGEAPAISVWEAIGDLGLVRGSRARPNTYASAPFSEFQKLMRADATALTDHEERPLRPRQQARYDALKPGEGLKELPPELRTKGGYSGAYGRLTKEMVAPTITRWVFHPGSGRFGHPVEHRILTIREAARLQSFSDDFVFVGANQTKSWQIGNAVPPLLMRAVAPSLRAALGRDATAPAREGTPRQLTLLRAGGDR
jgi:DNA (cytosine-5)-methyltransferase 1